MSKKTIQISFIILMFLVLGSQTLISQITSNNSAALETLLQQINENYVPSDWVDTMNNMEKLSKTIPQAYFTFLGAAMNKQKGYINSNPIASQNFKNLNREILFQIPDIVDLKNSLISNNNEKISDNLLLSIYDDALIGIINENFKQAYKNHTGKDLSQISMPSVLDQHLVGGTSFRKVAKKDKNEINLLDVAVKGGAVVSDGITRNAVSSIPKEQICPDQGNKDFYIDTNGVPNDGTHCFCKYKYGFLDYQSQVVNNKRHGMNINYSVTTGIRHLSIQTPYINGKEHGEQITYGVYTYHGDRIGIESVTQYVNGIQHGIHESWYMTDSGINYIKQTREYVNGNCVELKSYQVLKTGKRFVSEKQSFISMNGKDTSHGDWIQYHSSGGVQAISTYNQGELTSTKCFYKNGEQIIIDADRSKGYPCHFSVSWSQTDWCIDKKTCECW